MAEIVERLRAALADRYRVERELGRGGMATVFLAHDLKHGRDVAVKVMHPEIASGLGAGRFLREIRTAARLFHPHILALFDSGEADGLLYYTMPYVGGESLAERIAREGPLPIEDALRLAREVAGALAYAHSQGIVHRDVKPGNILLVDERHACVADFGLAHAVSTASSPSLTATGFTLGSPLYMAPEQIAGKEDVDGRADVYSLGCVLFEMLTGRPPFEGGSVQEVLSRRLVQEPPSVRTLRPAVPVAVESFVTACLARAPDRRPAIREGTAAANGWELGKVESSFRLPLRTVAHRHSRWLVPIAGAVGVALFSVAGLLVRGMAPADDDPPPSARNEEFVVPVERSIAVLPFEDLSEEPDMRYFSDGIREDLLTSLSGVGDLRVISRNSTSQYRDSEKSVREIGTELGVSAVLMGSVRRIDDRVRITAHLVNARTDELLWADSYDRDVVNIFQIQSDIAAEIVAALRAELTPEQRIRIARTPTGSLTAYDYYLKGREHLNRFREPQDLRTAIGLFHQALEVDPGFALADAGLGRAYQMLFQYTGSVGRDSAIFYAERAISRDPSLADGYDSLGRIYSSTGRYPEALSQLGRALELNPNHAGAMSEVSQVNIKLGRYDEALRWAKRAVAVEPTTASGYAIVGELYFDLDNLPEAERWLRQALALEPDELWANALMAHLHMARGNPGAATPHIRALLTAGPTGGWSQLQAGHFALRRGDYLAARQYYEEALDRLPAGDLVPLEYGFAHWVLGARAEAESIFEEHAEAAHQQIRRGDSGPAAHLTLARIHAAQEQTETALQWLEDAHARGARDLYFILGDPLLESLAGDPRYEAVLARIRSDLDRMRVRVDRQGW